MLPHFRGDFLIIWIPAYAGTTNFLLMDKPDELKLLMGSIASDAIAAVLAAAKIDGFCFRCFVLFWSKSTSFVAAVAKWLTCTFAAGTEPVAFASFNFYGVGRFLSDMGFDVGHVLFL